MEEQHPQNRLENLERAEDLVIGMLESAGNVFKELKEIQSTEDKKNQTFIQNVSGYYKQLEELKDILIDELDSLQQSQAPVSTRPGIDKLAISEWEAKIIADNLHELLPNDDNS